MLRRIICILSAFLMLTQCVCVNAAEFISGTDISVNEPFDNYPTNYVMDKDIMTVSGIGAMVTQSGKNNKALHCTLENSSFKVSVPMADIGNEMIYSFDMMTKGGFITGDILASGSVKLFNLSSDGKIKLYNNYYTGGYTHGVWRNYAIGVNYSTMRISLWIDGKLVEKNMILNSSYKKPTDFVFNFASFEKDVPTDIYIDNIRAYKSTKLITDDSVFYRGYNNETEEIAKEEEETVESKSISYIDSYGKIGIDTKLAQWTYSEWAKPSENHVECLHFNQTDYNGPFADVFIRSNQVFERQYIYQADILPISIQTGTVNFAQPTANDKSYSFLLQINSSGYIVCNGVSIAKIPMGEWSNIAIAVNLDSGLGTIYLNREVLRENVQLHNGGTNVPVYIRVGFNTVGTKGHNEMYINGIKFYSGTKLREFNDEAKKEALINNTYCYTGEDEFEAKAVLGDDTVFMTANDKYYINGEKNSYKEGEKPHTDENGKISLPSSLVAKALGISENDITEKSSINGADYVSADYISKELGKYVYTDNRGYVLISDVQRNYSDAVNVVTNLEDSDVIWRYMLFDRPSGDKLLEDIEKTSKGMHPRMFIREDEIPEFRAMIENDKDLKREVLSLINVCENHIKSEVVPYKFNQSEGPRLFTPFLKIRQRIFDLAVGYWATGEERYLERMWVECQNVLTWEHYNFPENGGSFLDSGNIGNGLALAYDTLYNYLTPDQRQWFRDQFEEKYLNYLANTFESRNRVPAGYAILKTCNWGAVTMSSAFLAGLAFIDDDHEDKEFIEKCKFIAESGLKMLEYPIGIMYPDGAVDEGLGYWTYYLEGVGWSIDALVNMCGTDYGFLSHPGYHNAISYGLNIQSSNGGYNYNVTTTESVVASPELFTIAKLYGDADGMEAIRSFYKSTNQSLGSRGLLAYRNLKTDGTKSEMSLDKLFPGLQIATMRSSYEDKNAAYVGILGGSNKSDTHFDKGSFIFDVGGVRWLRDQGDEKKDVTGGYYHSAGWNLYVKRTEAHNNLVINPYPNDIVTEFIADNPTGRIKNTNDTGYVGQAIGSRAEFTKQESKEKGAITVIDLTSTYGDDVTKYERGFYLGDDRRSLVVQDEITFTEGEKNIYWFLNTASKSETVVADNKTAYIKKQGKTLKVELITDLPDYKFEVMDAEPLDRAMVRTGAIKEYGRANYKKLAITGKTQGKLNVTVKFTLCDGLAYEPISFKPISEWTIPDGQVADKPDIDMIYLNGEPIKGFDAAIGEYTVETKAGEATPAVTASSTDGTEISVSSAEGGNVTIKAAKGGLERIVNVKFVVIEKTEDDKIVIEPEIGLPSNVSLLSASTVTATDVPEEDNVPINTQDGDFVSRWTSQTDGASLTIDLGEVRDIDGIAVAFYYGASRNYKYDIQYSADGKTYTELASGLKSSGDTDQYEWIAAKLKTRYIKFIGHGHETGGWNNMSEFRAGILKK